MFEKHTMFKKIKLLIVLFFLSVMPSVSAIPILPIITALAAAAAFNRWRTGNPAVPTGAAAEGIEGGAVAGPTETDAFAPDAAPCGGAGAGAPTTEEALVLNKKDRRRTSKEAFRSLNVLFSASSLLAIDNRLETIRLSSTPTIRAIPEEEQDFFLSTTTLMLSKTSFNTFEEAIMEYLGIITEPTLNFLLSIYLRILLDPSFLDTHKTVLDSIKDQLESFGWRTENIEEALLQILAFEEIIKEISKELSIKYPLLTATH